ncbi:MAG: AI-2E family transporter [Lachnospiraceae bacterium]|nr:AI-2E family transporter [Lachnospiraceae bacterium]
MKIEWKTCIRLGVTVFLVYLGIHYWDTIAQFGNVLVSAAGALIMGCVIAYILNILMSFYERFYFPKSKENLLVKSRRPICMIASMITLVAVVFLIIRLIVPELSACVQLLFKEVPEAMEELAVWLRDSEYVKEIIPEDFTKSLAEINWEEKITQIVNVLLEGVGGAAQVAISAVSSAVSVIMNLVIGLIFAIYLLSGKESLSSQFGRVMKRYLNPTWDHRIRYVLATLDGCFHRFIVGQCTEAVILGGLCMIGMTILKLPYAVMIGALIGFTALIPVAGAYIGGAVGAFMIFTVSPFQAVVFLIYLVVLQQLEGNLIYPKVVGTSIGLPGMWVLAAVTIGGAVMGVTGMLIGVPAAAAAYQLLKQDVKKGEMQLAEAGRDGMESGKCVQQTCAEAASLTDVQPASALQKQTDVQPASVLQKQTGSQNGAEKKTSASGTASGKNRKSRKRR